MAAWRFATGVVLCALFGPVMSVYLGTNTSSYRGVMNLCPESCVTAGEDPSNWTAIVNQHRFKGCLKNMLFTFAYHTPIGNSSTTPLFKACSVEEEVVDSYISPRLQLVVNPEDSYLNHGNSHLTVFKDTSNSPSFDNHTAQITNQTESGYEMAWWRSDEPSISSHLITGALTLQAHLRGINHNIEPAVMFAYSGSAVLGVYVGTQLDPQILASTAIETLIQQMAWYGTPGRIMVQLCGQDRTSRQTFGMFAATGPSALADVQEAIQSWDMANCVEGADDALKLAPQASATISAPPWDNPEGVDLRYAVSGACQTRKVVSGDGCASLASSCGISGNDFMTYNPQSNICSTLQPGQLVCCSPGSLPDQSPRQNADGSCASYTVVSGDYCAKIAAERGVSIRDIESWNANTWGWTGCTNVQVGVNICLSTGGIPMPAPLANAVCGPQKPGTVAPSDRSTLAELNPCPLNSCCNIWGQCGTTADFCSKSGNNRCISNCGMKIVSSPGPPYFGSIAYFEGFNPSRRCLHMSIDQLDTAQYTHIHFSFATITPDYRVDVSDTYSEFEKFKSLKSKSAKKILSFGGWTFSTSPSTYMRFREAMKPGNRDVLARNVADFIYQNSLDGADFDWEYPSAPDIPDIPAGDLSEGENYAVFLSTLRELMPDKSIAIAAPASFWYLKGFPIEKIGRIVDYMVYMTYDLHGQWDFDNQWAVDGCRAGNCLRSHVNWTETVNALSMITKAGVPSNKVFVGVSSYGRSFKMTTPGCTGPMCTYVGKASGAKEGRCTATAGYLADAEINEIIKSGQATLSWYDGNSGSDFLVYDNLEWVAYMSPATKQLRANVYKMLGFGGISDWAVDLQEFFESSSPSGGAQAQGGWRTKDCRNLGVTDLDLDPSERWALISGDDAWSDVTQAWRNRPKGSEYSFSRFVSNFLNGPPGMDCDIRTEQNGCSGDMERCYTTDRAGAAAVEILNSFKQLSNSLANYDDALESAKGSLTPSMVAFANAFAPAQETDKTLLIVIELATLGFSLASMHAFNSVMKVRLDSKGSDGTATEFYDNVKDDVKSLATMGFNIAKLKIGPGKDVTLDVIGRLSKGASELVDMWKASVHDMQAQLFDGSDSSVDLLGRMMSDGKLLSTQKGRTISQIKVKEVIMKITYLYLIPVAWTSRSTGVFIADSGYSCGTKDPMNIRDISPADAAKAAACVDEKLYYLLQPSGHSQTCISNRGPVPYCVLNQFVPATGIENLEAYMLTLSNLVTSAVRGYHAAGKKNGAWTPKILEGDAYNELYDMIDNKRDVGDTPGIAYIPVCSIKEARDNWLYKGGKDGENWPCNS